MDGLIEGRKRGNKPNASFYRKKKVQTSVELKFNMGFISSFSNCLRYRTAENTGCLRTWRRFFNDE